MILFTLCLFVIQVWCGEDIDICLDRVVSGSSLIDVRASPATGELFVIEKAGLVRRVNEATKTLQTMVDLSASVSNSGERGLLSFAMTTWSRTLIGASGCNISSPSRL